MRHPAPWQRRYDNLALLALLFGILSQYVFVGNGFNVSVPIFVAAFYGLFFYAVRGRIGGFERWRGQTKSGWLLTLPVGLLSLTFALFADDDFRTLNLFILPALIAAQTVLLTRNSDKPWFRPRFYGDVLTLALVQPFAYVAVPFGLLANRLMPKPEGGGRRTAGKARRIAIGLLLAAPPLLVVTVLLATADQIFGDLIWRVPSLLLRADAFEGAARIIVGAWFALYAFCYLWALLFNRSDPQAAELKRTLWLEAETETSGAAEKREPFGFDPLTANTLLISFNAVYLVFAAIQFSYLFGAANGLLPDGAAYADYARQGFAQLVAVAVINLLLLLGGLHAVRQGSPLERRARRLSLSLLVGFTVVMLVSAFSRLSLYEDAYGFTRTRLLVHGFMIILCFVLAVSLIRIWRDRFPLAKSYIAIGLAAYVAFNYANLDRMIAAKNAERYEASGNIDMAYMMTLSADAVPPLLQLRDRHPEGVEGLEVVFASIRERSEGSGGWPAWNRSKSRALRELR
ncbi:DUF4153 domain-containing protein [Paenibacillus sp. GCM10023250]|uniref:DUF4153 domain-containing protein n=1 Tax=Paenibacillus sp. GCM10023250 TaxID=3252648 RepID=UPI00360B9B79